MKIFNIITLITFFLSATFAYCDNLELLELKADMAESTFLTNKSDENLSEFVSSYETLIIGRCLPEITENPNYQGEPKNEKCLAAITRVLQVDGANPVALCARDGFTRRTCLETTGKQLHGNIDPSNGYWSSIERRLSGRLTQLDTAAAVSQKSAQNQVNEIKSKLYGIESWDRTQKHDEKLIKELKSYAVSGIKLSCNYSKIALISDKNNSEIKSQREFDQKNIIPDDPVSSTQELKPKSNSPISQVLDQFEKILPTAIPTLAPLPLKGPINTRVRLLTADCNEFIKKLLILDPTSSLATCYLDGALSPSCQDAKRRDGVKPGTIKPPQVSAGGYSNF